MINIYCKIIKMKILITEAQYNLLLEMGDKYRVKMTFPPSSISFEKIDKNYYKVIFNFSKFPGEYFKYVYSLDKSQISDVKYFENMVYIEASEEFNRVHFREGIHPLLQGIGLGYAIYEQFIKFLGFGSTGKSATPESKKVWYKLFNNPNFYGVICNDNIFLVDKNWNGDIKSKIKSFLEQKCYNNKKFNDSVLNDFPELTNTEEDYSSI